MASSSTNPAPGLSKAAASKIADEWEAEVKRLIEHQDRDAWNDAQNALYEGLVSFQFSTTLAALTVWFIVSCFCRLETIPISERRLSPLGIPRQCIHVSKRMAKYDEYVEERAARTTTGVREDADQTERGTETQGDRGREKGKEGAGKGKQKAEEKEVEEKRGKVESEKVQEVKVVKKTGDVVLRAPEVRTEVRSRKTREEEGDGVTGSEDERTTGQGEKKGNRKRGLVHAPGGRMTVPRAKKKEIKSDAVVLSSGDEEEAPRSRGKPKPKPLPVEEKKSKGKAKPKGKGKPKRKVGPEGKEDEGRTPRTKSKRRPLSDDDEEEKDDDNDHDDDEEEEEEEEEEVRVEDEAEDRNSKTPLARARQRQGSKKLPQGDSDNLPKYLELDDKCGQCSKAKLKCVWTVEAIKKSGAKACTRCKERKIGCINGFRSSGPMLVDLTTPLDLEDHIADRLAGPQSHADGVPRAGVAGENPEVPTTLGELLIELLSTVRAVKEENEELRSEVKVLSRTLGTIMAYDTQNHRQVMEQFESLPSKIQAALPSPFLPLPPHDVRRAMYRRGTSPRPNPPTSCSCTAPPSYSYRQPPDT